MGPSSWGIDLTGVVITGDATHAQHATAAHLTRERGGDYVLTAKGNQPSLLGQIAAALPNAVPGTEHHVTEDRSKGRIVCRSIWVAPAAGVEFPGATQVFRFRRDAFDHKGTRLSKEVVHGVISLIIDQADPEAIAGFIRQHWGIENKIHWVRDVVYRADTQHAYSGTGAQVMAISAISRSGCSDSLESPISPALCNASPSTEPETSGHAVHDAPEWMAVRRIRLRRWVGLVWGFVGR